MTKIFIAYNFSITLNLHLLNCTDVELLFKVVGSKFCNVELLEALDNVLRCEDFTFAANLDVV